jgi:hypothetical protein
VKADDRAASKVSRLDLARWVDLDPHRDPGGTLTALEGGETTPFEIRRVYFMQDLSAERGGHAHRDTEQLLVCLTGSCEVRLSDGREERVYECRDPSRGLYIVPMLFIRLSRFAPGTVILVLASTHYNRSRSIRSWEEYLEAVDVRSPLRPSA